MGYFQRYIDDEVDKIAKQTGRSFFDVMDRLAELEFDFDALKAELIAADVIFGVSDHEYPELQEGGVLMNA